MFSSHFLLLCAQAEMRIHILCTYRGASLQGLLYFTKGAIGVNQTVPNKCHEAPAMAINVLHQETTESFLILGVQVGSWKEISNTFLKEPQRAFHLQNKQTNNKTSDHWAPPRSSPACPSLVASQSRGGAAAAPSGASPDRGESALSWQEWATERLGREVFYESSTDQTFLS